MTKYHVKTWTGVYTIEADRHYVDDEIFFYKNGIVDPIAAISSWTAFWRDDISEFSFVEAPGKTREVET